MNILGAALAIALLLPSLAMAQGVRAGKWTSGVGQGIVEHIVRNGPGNDFNISCDVGYSEDAELTGISISIRDNGPPPKSTVRIFIDDEEFQFGVDDHGGIKTNYRVNADNFIALWETLRSGKSMRVLFEDGRTSSFSLDGAKKVLGSKPCGTNFYAMPSKPQVKKPKAF
ncbi:hypothetical protein [Microvirga arsenatis]|uniref:Uncharacterized protein n=1 Tax=Microvirga arsenatis TaxID=2692265 RepID=A0ABW9Z4Y1_9HYPH|nr:hypothetical protein [Microvirga arsenatis]NBJ13698.1 hypothetical protein [Microvirga arsenatis]NBJ27152.1 hypothetical protein [Microvirga arsenatis]